LLVGLVGHSVIPDVIFVDVVIDDGWLPVGTAGELNMWELFPLLVRVQSHRCVWEAGSDIQGGSVAFWGYNSLSTPCHLERLVVDIHAVDLQVGAGVDSLALSHVGISVHDEDDLASLCLNHGTDRDDGDVSEPVIIDALYVHNFIDSVDDAGVGPTNTTIAASVNECSPVLDLVIGCPVCDIHHVAGSELDAIDDDLSLFGCILG
jgi:hypothetical protein